MGPFVRFDSRRVADAWVRVVAGPCRGTRWRGLSDGSFAIAKTDDDKLAIDARLATQGYRFAVVPKGCIFEE